MSYNVVGSISMAILHRGKREVLCWHHCADGDGRNPLSPASFANLQIAVDKLPTYTPTGTIATLHPLTFTLSVAQTKNMDGWHNNQDNSPAYTPVSSCEHPDPWNAIGTPVPLTCGGGT